MAEQCVNIRMTGVAGGSVKKANIAGIVYGGMGNTIISGSDQEKELLARTRDEIEFMTAGMIRVSAVDIVLHKLKAGQRWVTITGNAGDGKTTLGYLVLKEFLQKNHRVFTIYKPEEYDLIAKMKEDMVIMFDDRFGAFLADQQLIKGWLDVLSKLVNSIESDKRNTRVIFVSRKNVVSESRVYLGKFTETMFDPSCVVDLSNRKMTDERLEILEYHLSHENVTDVLDEIKKRVSNKDIAHGFPHCSKMYSKLRSNGFNVDIEEFFESPLKFLDMTTKVLYKANCKDLFQMMIKNDGKLDANTIEDEDKRQALLQIEKEQEGSYITIWRNGICEFAHPSVYESVLNVINEIDPLYCIQYANLSVIRQKMVISTSDEEDHIRAPCYIIVKPIPAVMKALAERFKDELFKGNYSVFKHRLCQSREFCEALVSCCVLTDEGEDGSNQTFFEALYFCCVTDKVVKQFINQPGEEGETMLWTALKSGHLTAVQTLVKAGADVNMTDEIGRTPLQYLYKSKNFTDVAPAADDDSIHRVHMDTIRVIITEGRADINMCDQFGQTHLHFLLKCRALNGEDIKWMVTEGEGDLNKCEQNKSTPLHQLCAYSDLQLDTVNLVIREGKGDFNKADEHGTTPFHFLCDNGNAGFDTVNRIVNTAKGDINTQDHNGVTPLHLLCKGSHQIEDILTLIHQGDKADMYGNTALHFLCRRPGINTDVLRQQLKQIPETDMNNENTLGYRPCDYLTDQDNTLPWTDGLIERSAADLVLCRLKQGGEEKWIVVIGPAMTIGTERVHPWLQVVDGLELNNMERRRDRDRPGRFWEFERACSSPVPVPPSSSPFFHPAYWETHSELTWKAKGGPLLEMGVVEGRGNLDKWGLASVLPHSLSVSVEDNCIQHPDRLCIRVLRRDRGDRRQVGECITLSHTPGQKFIFKHGLVMDVGRGKVALIDLEREKLLCKQDLMFTEWVFPMFYVHPVNDHCPTKMKLVCGREIFVTDRKINLIQQALFD